MPDDSEKIFIGRYTEKKRLWMFALCKGTIKVVMLQSNSKFHARSMPDDSEKIYIGWYTEKKKVHECLRLVKVQCKTQLMK